MSEFHRVLLVEDEEEFAIEFRDIILQMDCEVVLVQTADEARQLLAEEHFCLMITDLNLPKMKSARSPRVAVGLSLIRDARRMHQEREPEESKHVLQIVVVTGHGKDHPQVVEALQEGADEYLIKPLRENNERAEVKLNRCFRKSGRKNHLVDCIRIMNDSGEPLIVRQAHLKIQRVKAGERCQVSMDDREVVMSDTLFEKLVRLAAARETVKGGLIKGEDLGEDPKNARGLSSLRKVLGASPALGKIIDHDGKGHGVYRILDNIRVTADWEALADVPHDAAVRSIAASVLKNDRQRAQAAKKAAKKSA